jgi:protein arginine kinase
VELADVGRVGGEWLKGSGAETDVVLSSRIRLARNVAGFPFATRCDDAQRAEILGRVKTAVESVDLGGRRLFVDVSAAPALESRFLVERHLVSRELVMGKGPRGAAFGAEERISLMVNEEDHLRLQSMASGLDLESAWEEARRVDRALEQVVPFAVSPQYGYLTACPTNVGTGLRASVMLHLPALAYTKQMEKVFQSCSRTGLAVRGFYGEGTMAQGDFYQISNQVTLGRSPEQAVADLQAMLAQVIEYERNSRAILLREDRVRLEDVVWRAWATLRYARRISSREALAHLSALRLGVCLQLIDTVKLRTLHTLMVAMQPGHLQLGAGRELRPLERDVVRAQLIRDTLGPA